MRGIDIRRFCLWLTAVLFTAACCSKTPPADDGTFDVESDRLSAGMLVPNAIGPLTEGLHGPARLAVTATDVWVADPQGDVVVRFDALTGAEVSSWPEPAGPTGIAVHPDGRVFVARRTDGRVAVYDSAFALQHYLADGVVEFIKPTDLAVDATGRILVVDSGADTVYVFDVSEALVLTIGSRGSASGQFKYPAAVASDVLNDRIVVADQDNYRVQVFDSSGGFLHTFGYLLKYVGGDLEAWMPRGIGLAVDLGGNIYLADALMSTVRIFDSSGAELGLVLEDQDLQTPSDLALSAGTGLLFVSNSAAHQIDVYDTESHVLLSRVIGAHFGGTNGSDDLPADDRAPAVSGWDPPHMLPDSSCQRCHGIDELPGGHEAQVSGQTQLCLSCHNGGGQGLATMILPDVDLGSSHAWNVPAVNEAYGSTGPGPGHVMSGRLDLGRIKCATCHDQHSNSAGVPFLRGPADALCVECHSDHTGHTPHGSWQPGCTACHEAHDVRSVNISLIRALVGNQTLAQEHPVVFTARSGPNSFDDGDPAQNDGICQVCHTATVYHRYDGTGGDHHSGETCTDCHRHEDGFLASGVGSCLSCHASAQDNGDGIPPAGRRAVVGEFPSASAHAHYGATLTDDACLVCHSIDTHMDGAVELIDPDDGSIYRFTTPQDLSSDPDLSDFCGHCHDADGAARLATPMDPFGNTNPPQDVASRFQGTLQWNEWYGDFCFGEEGTLRAVNSHHDISDADQAFSGAKLECLNCHGAHSAAASQPLVDPFATTTVWTGSGNGFCLACHAGGVGPADPGFPPEVIGPSVPLRGIDSCDYTAAPWYVDYSWTHSAHGLDSKRAWDGYSGAPGQELDCAACHDPHGSYTAANTPGNPYMIRDFVDGTPFVDDGTHDGGFNGPPFDTFGTAREVTVTVSGIDVSWGANDGLCSACHASWLEGMWAHDFCNGCQTCHGHGQAWEQADVEDYNDDTPCPLPVTFGIDATTGPPLHLFESDADSMRLDELRQYVRPE